MSQTESGSTSSQTTGNNVTGDSASNGTETSTVFLSVSETNQSLSVTANENDTSTISQTSSANSISGAFSNGESSTSDTSRSEMITNQTLVMNNGTKQHHTTGSSSETGNEITGDFTLDESSSDTFTNSETDTNQTLTASHVETGLTDKSDTEAGNNILGNVTGTSDSQTTDTVAEYDSNQAFLLTSTLVTVVISTAVTASNQITGDTSTSTHETSTSTQSELEVNPGSLVVPPSGGSVGQTVSFTETGSSVSDAIDIGNSITGSDSQTEQSSESTTTTQTNTNSAGLSDGGTLVSTNGTSLTRTGNDITGDYSLTEIDTTGSTQDQSGTTSPPVGVPPSGGTADDSRSFTLDDSGSSTTTRHESGNDFTGASSYCTTGTSSDTLTKSDTYVTSPPVGQAPQPDGNDAQTVITTGTSNASGSANSLTGSFSETGGDSTTVTTNESGLRSGQSYSLSATDTTVNSGRVTTGNNITGDESVSETTTETSTLSNGATASTGSFTLLETNQTTTTLLSTSNLVTGSYSESATENSSTSTVQLSYFGGSFTLSANSSDDLLLTRLETGNSITGGFSRSVTEIDSTTFIESGTNAAGSFSVSETTASSPTVQETGNSVTGDYTLIEISTQDYTLDETNVGVPPSGGLTPTYTLHETGSNPTTLIQTGSTITGDYSQTVTGTDSYTLAESGALTNSTGNHTYTETLTATDTSTAIEIGNSLNGTFQRTVTGAIAGSMIETGDDNGVGYVRPTDIATGYTVTDTGNYVDGSISLTETGTDRYALLEQFNNTSNAVAGNGPGNVDYSPTGAPFSIGQGPVVPTSGTAYPGEQSPAAEQQDPFAQQGLDLLHEYCFRAGTFVLTKESLSAEARSKPIEDVVVGDWVACVDENNPDGPIVWRQVQQVFHNAPARVLNVHLGDDVVGTTFNHPWFVRNKGWISAADLEIGDELRSSDDAPLAVTDLFDTGIEEPVFNLRVEGCHTYFVSGRGARFAWVHNVSPVAAATPKQVKNTIGDWNKVTEFSVSDVNKLVKAGVATQMLTGTSYSVNVHLVTNIAVRQDDGSVGTLTLKKSYSWFGNPYYEKVSYKAGATPAQTAAAQDAKQAAGHETYMKVHEGIQKVQAGILAAPAAVPIFLAAGTATTTTGMYAAYGYATASLTMSVDQAVAGARDINDTRNGKVKGEGNETLATELFASGIQKATGTDRDTAVKYGRLLNLAAVMFVDAAPGVKFGKVAPPAGSSSGRKLAPVAEGGPTNSNSASKLPNRESIAVRETLDVQDARKVVDDPIHDAYTNQSGARPPGVRPTPTTPKGTWVNESTAGWSNRAKAYQEQITGRPAGQAYEVNGTRFDGPDPSGPGLVDAKGPGYATKGKVVNGRFARWFSGADGLVKDARRQLAAAPGTKITWHVAEQEAATAIRKLFKDNGITGIDVVQTPPTAP